jgi:hypothetical protein
MRRGWNKPGALCRNLTFVTVAVRRRVPVPVRLTATGLFVIGVVLVLLSLTATGVMLSDLEVDPARQHGTGYFDFVLFFNGVLCLLPLDGLVIVLGYRLLRGDHWAWWVTMLLCGFFVTVVPLLVLVLPAPLPFAVVPALLAISFAVLLCTPSARAWTSPADPQGNAGLSGRRAG